MMSKLTNAHDEADRLLQCFLLHKDSEDQEMRRKVYLDLDRYLMQNRELAITCIEQVLAGEIKQLRAEARKAKKKGVLRRFFSMKGVQQWNSTR